jgi:sigma-B regulation protein RsbU (phosphoserine phosphatase)
VSGDLYDFFEHGTEYTLIAFGDVSGKGAAAALFGALISGVLRTLGPQHRSPSNLMKSLNEALLERKVDAQYATLELLLWDSRDCSFTITNAGALPPLLVRNREVIEPHVEGVPIGLLEDQEYDQVKIPVERNDLLLLYSDGVEDQLRDDEEEYGRERLRKLLASTHDRTPQEVVKAIFEDLDVFRGATPVTDDLTVIALKVL